MGIRKRKPAVTPARARKQPQPVASAYAAEVRQRAEKLAEPVESQAENATPEHNRQRQQAEQQMAKLRSEAVQARRLAEHIENLSQDTVAYKHKRKLDMTNTTIVDPGHAQRLQRRADDKPGPCGSQLNFNPLHPSMELPPEQLIRLLGMESKKIRKSRKTRHTPKAGTATPQTTLDVEADNTPPPVKLRPQTVRPVNSSIQYERSEPPQVFDSGRSGLLVPALLVGVVTGIAISGYLFWNESADTAIQQTPAAAVAKQPLEPQSKRELVQRKPASPAPIATSTVKQKMSVQENAAWQAAIEAQEQRLHTAAEQRLAERISKLQQTSRQAELQPAPTRSVLPVPAPEPVTMQAPVANAVMPAGAALEAPLETASQPGSDTPLTEPVPTAVEMPDVQVSPAEFIQTDTQILPVTPGESATGVPATPETIPESDDTTAGNVPDIEPVPAAPVVSDIEPEARTPAESESVLTDVTVADEPPAVPANNELF